MRVVALSGGIGGAKLALGLSLVLPDGALTVVGNTADDFEPLGLAVSPDLDTVMYTLAGVDNPATGWGRRDETWSFMAALGQLGGESWFRLGDRDLATHVERTRRLRAGETLSAITASLCARLGVAARLLPMSDGRVRTRVLTEGGWLDFQDWFVRLQCGPAVQRIVFEGAAAAVPAPGVLDAVRMAEAIVICPSNPFISVDPILAVPGLRQALIDSPAPVIAVSPIIAGRAVKGPTAKLMAGFGVAPSAAAVARHYAGLIDVLVAEPEDAPACRGLAPRVVAAATLMTTLDDRTALARAVLAAAAKAAGA